MCLTLAQTSTVHLYRLLYFLFSFYFSRATRVARDRAKNNIKNIILIYRANTEKFTQTVRGPRTGCGHVVFVSPASTLLSQYHAA